MSALERIYLALPVPLQEIACDLEGWKMHRRRYGGKYPQLLRECQERSGWSVDRLRAFRDARLAAFVRHAVDSVPGYRATFRRLGIQPEEIRSLDDLARLPILAKEDLQNQLGLRVSTAVPHAQQHLARTSGTTGGGLCFATTLDAIREQWAVWWRYRAWHGLSLGVPCAYFGGRSVVPACQRRPPFWRHSGPLRQVLFSGYHMRPDNLAAYVQELRRVRPPWLHGYPSLLALLATYVLDGNIDLGYKVGWVTVGAENLLPQQADVIARAFGVRVRQHYGMAEGVANFSECESGRLHVDEDFAAVEFVPSGDGVSYRVIGTNLSNLATPLLRYDVQDSVTLCPEGCNCGRPGRVVEAVDGRKEDYVLLKNGAKLGRLDHIFKDHTHIREAQIYQNVPGELVLRIVRGKLYSQADENRLLTDTRQRVGSEAEIRLEYLQEITRTVGGKLRFVVSDLPEGKLGGTQT